jgi:hypothetical protein
MSIVSNPNRYAVGQGLRAGVARSRPLSSRPLVVTDATSMRPYGRRRYTISGRAARPRRATDSKGSGVCVGASRPHSASPRLGTGISMQPCAVSRAATGTPRFSIQHSWPERPSSHALYHPARRTGRFNPAPGAPPIAQRLRNCGYRNGSGGLVRTRAAFPSKVRPTLSYVVTWSLRPSAGSPRLRFPFGARRHPCGGPTRTSSPHPHAGATSSAGG